MKARCRLLLITTFCLPGWLAGSQALAAAPLTLDEFFQAALERSETVAVQMELIRQAEERYKQANAALFPELQGVASYTRESPESPFDRRRQARLTATQPLFRGFREFAALRQGKALIGAQTQALQQARVQLFKDVAQNFYDVLTLEQDIRNVENQIDQNLKREAEIRERARIGRARSSELLTVQSATSTLRAELEQLQGQLLAAREVFAFLSGLPADTPLNDSEALPVSPQPLEDYLARIEERPDVKAARQRVAAAAESRAIARGERWPSVDLTANRYLDQTDETRDIDWDVTLSLTVPLYAGGAIQSRIREAESLRVQTELEASEVERQAQREVRAVYQSALFDLSRLKALENATDAARRNYEAQQRDYRLGLVTNLDVLQALAEFQNNQRALDRARYAAKLNHARLQAAALLRPVLPPIDTTR